MANQECVPKELVHIKLEWTEIEGAVVIPKNTVIEILKTLEGLKRILQPLVK